MRTELFYYLDTKWFPAWLIAANDLSSTSYTSFATVVDVFSWKRSAQGHEYWADISISLPRIANLTAFELREFLTLINSAPNKSLKTYQDEYPEYFI